MLRGPGLKNDLRVRLPVVSDLGLRLGPPMVREDRDTVHPVVNGVFKDREVA